MAIFDTLFLNYKGYDFFFFDHFQSLCVNPPIFSQFVNKTRLHFFNIDFLG